ncbi:MAG: septum formation inhibitor Maf [Magnetococcales bacterium]|nr:septum formation inhibitor Maf [Magnetococcales bacterium]
MLLRQVGLDPEVHPTDVDETRHIEEHAVDYVRRMALTKARAGVMEGIDLVLGADTAVVLEDEIMGKPRDQADAMAMLSRLSGREHRVLTGVALCSPDHPQGRAVVVESRVRFKILSDAEIHAYVASGEPFDKAGAYAIQGLGAAWVAHVSGSYSGVVGLPLFETMELLRDFGLTFSAPE